MPWYLYVFSEEVNKCLGICMFFSEVANKCFAIYMFYMEANKCFGIWEYLQTLSLKTSWIIFFPEELTNALVSICFFPRELANALLSICFSRGSQQILWYLYVFCEGAITNAVVSIYCG
jgi:hypothetical protein